MIVTPINSQRSSYYVARGRGKSEATLHQYSCYPRLVGRACVVAAQQALGHAQVMAGGVGKENL